MLHGLHKPDGPSNWFLAGYVHAMRIDMDANRNRIHQDIQPANILVFPQDASDSPFDVKFKLTDFGLTEFGRLSCGKIATVNRGNRMYSKCHPVPLSS